jgi:hypothetical protein
MQLQLEARLGQAGLSTRNSYFTPIPDLHHHIDSATPIDTPGVVAHIASFTCNYMASKLTLAA